MRPLIFQQAGLFQPIARVLRRS